MGGAEEEEAGEHGCNEELADEEDNPVSNGLDASDWRNVVAKGNQSFEYWGEEYCC